MIDDYSKEAFKLQQNPALKKALQEVRNRCYQQVEICQTDSELKESQLMLRVVTEFERVIESFIKTGEVEDYQYTRQLEPIE